MKFQIFFAAFVAITDSQLPDIEVAIEPTVPVVEEAIPTIEPVVEAEPVIEELPAAVEVPVVEEAPIPPAPEP